MTTRRRSKASVPGNRGGLLENPVYKSDVTGFSGKRVGLALVIAESGYRIADDGAVDFALVFFEVHPFMQESIRYDTPHTKSTRQQK